MAIGREKQARNIHVESSDLTVALQVLSHRAPSTSGRQLTPFQPHRPARRCQIKPYLLPPGGPGLPTTLFSPSHAGPSHPSGTHSRSQRASLSTACWTPPIIGTVSSLSRAIFITDVPTPRYVFLVISVSPIGTTATWEMDLPGRVHGCILPLPPPPPAGPAEGAFS